jgi:hypothetical protein
MPAISSVAFAVWRPQLPLRRKINKTPVGAGHARDFFRGLCGLATAAIARAHGTLLRLD